MYYQPLPKAAFTEKEAAALPEEQRAKLRKLDFDTAVLDATFYGSPLAYARALPVPAAGLDSYDGRKILDYGYGTVGHLRVLAGCGAAATGVDVDPIRGLYSRPGDQGRIEPRCPAGTQGASRSLRVSGQAMTRRGPGRRRRGPLHQQEHAEERVRPPAGGHRPVAGL